MSVPHEMPPWTNQDLRMMDEQRLIEQSGKNRFGKVYAKERQRSEADANAQSTQGMDEGFDASNQVEQHPLLDGQLWDGAAEKLSLDLSGHPDAKTALENAKRDKEMEKQLRLENQLDLDHVNRPQFHPRPF